MEATSKHALIIEDNQLVSRVIEERLVPLGFRSFDHVWTEDDALAAARRHFPDLVVVGDEVTTGSGVEAARQICDIADVPVLLVTANGAKARRSLPAGAWLEGPLPLAEIDHAVEEASQDLLQVA